MAWKVTASQLESDRFGIQAAKLVVESVADVDPAIEKAKDEKFNFLSARVDVGQLALVQKLESKGFFLTDTLVYYKKKLRADAVTPSSPKGYVVRLAGPKDYDQIISAASLSFQGYLGHYHADGKFDAKKADEVYVDWIRRSCYEGLLANAIYVTEENGEISSFATVKKDGEKAEGVLFGVHPAHQGKGIYKELIIASMNWGLSQGCTEIHYSTQITNMAVQKVWAREGCELNKAYYTFHYWA